LGSVAPSRPLRSKLYRTFSVVFLPPFKAAK
jgi:hypothetical protein